MSYAESSSVESIVASTLQKIASAVAGPALLVALAGCGGHSGGRVLSPPPPAPPATTVDVGTAVPPAAPPAAPLTISSPAFADGAPIPARFSCKGENIAPPLAWSAPSDAAELALVLDDPDAVGGLYVHWIVIGIAPGPGSTAAGQTPANGRSLPNSGGQGGYFGPCPPAGSGTHHYRFTLYQLAAPLELPTGSTGVPAVQAIAGAAGGQARLTGTFQG